MAPFDPTYDLKFDSTKIESRVLKRSSSSKWVSMGKRTQQLGEDFVRLVGMEYEVAVTDFTAAPHLAIPRLVFEHDVEIIVPSLTFGTSALTIRHVGTQPVFTDIVSRNEWVETNPFNLASI